MTEEKEVRKTIYRVLLEKGLTNDINPLGVGIFLREEKEKGLEFNIRHYLKITPSLPQKVHIDIYPQNTTLEPKYVEEVGADIAKRVKKYYPDLEVKVQVY